MPDSHDKIVQLAVDALQESGSDTARLFHGRGRRFPGYEHLSIDYFHPVILLTIFEPVGAAWLSDLYHALRDTTDTGQVECIALQERHLSGGPVSVLWGELPRKPCAVENGLRYGIQLGGRQNTGFFLDMAEAREWVSRHSQGRRVLNLFAYTCAFSVVARSAGAKQVVNLDMSASALRQGQQNHQRNGIADGVQFLSHDLFRSWGKLRRLAPFDLIIVDPPSRQPGSFVADRDYRRVVQKLPQLCGDGADVLLCLNSPHLDSEFLRTLVAEHAPELEFRERLPNPTVFADENEELSLKVMHYVYSQEVG